MQSAGSCQFHFLPPRRVPPPSSCRAGDDEPNARRGAAAEISGLTLKCRLQGITWEKTDIDGIR